MDYHGGTLLVTPALCAGKYIAAVWGALHSNTGRVSCVCDWLRDAIGLDFGDR